jgi:alanine dehydrogenase
LLYLSDREVVALDLPRERVVDAVAAALGALGRGEVEQPAKTGLHPTDGLFFHALPVHAGTLGAAGVKWVSYAPGNDARGVPRASATLLLSDPETGHPLCLVEALAMTAARTAACAAVAARHLARPGAEVLTLVGAGPVNRGCLPYLADALPELREIRVVAGSEASAARHAAEIAESIEVPVVPFAGPEPALEGSDVILSAIGGQATPPLREEWLGPGALALPLEGEAAWDTATFHAADKVIADDAAVLVESFARNRPEEQPPTVDAELGAVVAGLAPGRESEAERIVDSNNGIGVLDVAVGKLILDEARAAGAGRDL